MSCLRKRVWIWCVLLLLPLQGLAAGGLLPCAFAKGVSQGATGVTMLQAAAHPCHGLAAEVAAGFDGQWAEATDPPADTDHRCSTCAACCVALALPGAAAMGGEPAAAPHPAAPPPPHVAEVPAAGPERPPRAALR
jgi:hypothetical protein